MTWGSLIQLLMNLPKILGAINSFIKMMEERAAAHAEKQHQDALQKLKDAKTEQEKKDAFKDYLDKP